MSYYFFYCHIQYIQSCDHGMHASVSVVDRMIYEHASLNREQTTVFIGYWKFMESIFHLSEISENFGPSTNQHNLCLWNDLSLPSYLSIYLLTNPS